MAYISFQPSDYFNTKLYTGTSSGNQAVTGVGFQPDWIWTKNRVDAFGSNLYDAIRGTGYYLQSNNTSTSQSAVTSLISFDSDGFTVGTGDNVQYTSNNGVAWNWKANGQGSSNTDGSINTTYTSASTTSGFSISTYTGTGANATVGHGLGVVPNIVLVKSTSNGEHWCMYNSNLGNTSRLLLNLTNAVETSRSEWQSTTPTSSVFSVDGSDQVNGSGSKTYVAYCFAEKKGFSKFGSYTGNSNADGAFIYTGFRPGWIMIKRYDSGTEDWNMWDSKRIGYNISGNDKLFANLNNAELTTEDAIDILSNGFKLRSTNGGFNNSSGSYIYMCFAEEPLVSSNGVPATAR